MSTGHKEFLMKYAIAALALVASLTASPTLAQVAAPADTKAVSDCLKKADDSGGLGNHCIGIVADPCVEKSDKMNATTKACAARELAVWTALTEAAKKRVRAGGFKYSAGTATMAERRGGSPPPGRSLKAYRR